MADWITHPGTLWLAPRHLNPICSDNAAVFVRKDFAPATGRHRYTISERLFASMCNQCIASFRYSHTAILRMALDQLAVPA